MVRDAVTAGFSISARGGWQTQVLGLFNFILNEMSLFNPVRVKTILGDRQNLLNGWNFTHL